MLNFCKTCLVIREISFLQTFTFDKVAKAFSSFRPPSGGLLQLTDRSAEVMRERSVNRSSLTPTTVRVKRPDTGWAGREELLIDGGEYVSFSPSVEGGGLALDVNGLRYTPPIPVGLFVKHGDTFFIY